MPDDPYDMTEKQKLNLMADEKNFITMRNGHLLLLCGAKKKKVDGFCRAMAGSGTSHPGAGRCKHCGGNNTGPTTQKGKDESSKNRLDHGFYSKGLSEKANETYGRLVSSKEKVTLVHEIYMLKAKVLEYLEKWQGINDMEGEAATRRIDHVSADGTIRYYYAGTIEDRALDRALRSLSSMIEKYGRMTSGKQGTDLLSQINEELAGAGASVGVSWSGGAAQHREGDEAK